MTKRIFGNISILLFINGFLLATLFYLHKEDVYEKDLFSAIVNKIKQELKTDNKDTFLIRSLAMTYELQRSRQSVFGDNFEDAKENSFFHSATTDLMTAYGACGSYSIVLARILKANNCKVKIGQMLVRGKFGGHIIVETEIYGKWVIIDPMFNLSFKRPDGKLADFKEVNKNWPYYSLQVPADYVQDYKYDGIRYANWTKIPVVLPTIKKILDFTLGKEKADAISIRPYFLRINHILFVLLLWFYIPLTAFTIWLYVKRKRAFNKSSLKNM